MFFIVFDYVNACVHWSKYTTKLQVYLVGYFFPLWVREDHSHLMWSCNNPPSFMVASVMWEYLTNIKQTKMANFVNYLHIRKCSTRICKQTLSLSLSHTHTHTHTHKRQLNNFVLVGQLTFPKEIDLGNHFAQTLKFQANYFHIGIWWRSCNIYINHIQTL